MNNSTLYHKINSLPENLKLEVQDFVDFLLAKSEKDIGKKARIFGCMKGKIKMAEDFDAPLEDFKEYM